MATECQPTAPNSGISSDIYKRIVMPVWGASYVQLFVKYGLPSQLSAGNIGCLAGDKRACYHICTTKADYPMLAEAESFHRLEDMIPVEIDFVDDHIASVREGHTKFNKMSYCHELGMARSGKRETAFFFLTADHVLCDGMIRRCLEHQAQGKRAVLVNAMPVWQPYVYRPFAEFYNEDQTVLTMSPRKLTQIMLDFFPPWVYVRFRLYGNTALSNFYWRLDDKTMLARCLHPHPFMVWPVHKKKGSIYPTVDASFVETVCPNYDDLYVVHDSDELSAVALELRNQQDFPDRYLGVREFAQWASDYSSPFHRRYMEERIIMHANDATLADSPIIQDSDRFVDSILANVRDIEAIVPEYTAPPGEQSAVRSLASKGRHYAVNAPRAAARIARRGLRAVKQRLKGLVRRVSYPLYRLVNVHTAPVLQLMKQHLVDIRETTARLDSDNALLPHELVKAPSSNGALADPTWHPPQCYHSPKRAYHVYANFYRTVIEYLAGARIFGSLVEFGAGTGFRARVLAESTFQNRYLGHLYLVDDYDSDSFVELSKGESITRRMVQQLRLIVPQGHVHVLSTTSDPLPSLTEFDKIAFLQFNDSTSLAALDILTKLVDADMLQDGCLIYFDTFNLGDRGPNQTARQAFEAFVNNAQDRWRSSPFVSCGWHGQAFVLHDAQSAGRVKLRPHAA